MASAIHDGILYVSDLDGTLLRRDGTLSAQSAALLNGCMERGLLFTIATARSWNSAGPLLSKLRLTLPVITYNGAFLVDPQTKRLLAASVFAPQVMDEARSRFEHAGVAAPCLRHAGRNGNGFLSAFSPSIPRRTSLPCLPGKRSTPSPGNRDGGSVCRRCVLLYRHREP